MEFVFIKNTKLFYQQKLLGVIKIYHVIIMTIFLPVLPLELPRCQTKVNLYDGVYSRPLLCEIIVQKHMNNNMSVVFKACYFLKKHKTCSRQKRVH